MLDSDHTPLMHEPALLIKQHVEDLIYKLQLYREYPWLLLEVLAPLFGGTVEQSKRRALRVIALYDGLLAAGRRAPRGFTDL